MFGCKVTQVSGSALRPFLGHLNLLRQKIYLRCSTLPNNTYESSFFLSIVRLTLIRLI